MRKLIAILFLAMGSVTWADKVFLTDGTVIQGEVKARTPEKIILEYEPGKFKAIPSSDVKEVEKDNFSFPAGRTPSPQAARASAPSPSPDDSKKAKSTPKWPRCWWVSSAMVEVKSLGSIALPVVWLYIASPSDEFINSLDKNSLKTKDRRVMVFALEERVWPLRDLGSGVKAKLVKLMGEGDTAQFLGTGSFRILGDNEWHRFGTFMAHINGGYWVITRCLRCDAELEKGTLSCAKCGAVFENPVNAFTEKPK